MDHIVSYYDILEISPQASDFEIKDSYRRLAFEFHPDRNPINRSLAERNFRLINEAYSHLKTREKRLHYNHWLRKQGSRGAANPQNDNRLPGKDNWLSQLAAFFTGSKDHNSRSGF